MDQVKTFKSYCEEISQHLECPVCLDFSKPPVKQCVNGHICCFSCSSFLVNCPTCRDAFLRRNSLINHIVWSFVKRCPFRTYGCRTTLSPMEYEDHVEKCTFRLIFCKICNRNVSARGFRNHVFDDHKDKAWLGESNVLYWKHFNFQQNLQSTEIVSAFSKLFWYCFSYNILDRSLNIAVQFIGPKLQADKYIYEIDSAPQNDCDNRITFKTTTHHYMDNVNYTLRTNGITIKQNFIMSILQDHSLLLHLNLYKKNESPETESATQNRTILSGS